MRLSSTLIAVSIALLLTAGLFLFKQSTTQDNSSSIGQNTPSTLGTATTQNSAQQSGLTQHQSTTSPDIQPEVDTIAASLADTQVDANLQFDDNGQLIADINLKRYFDYFLSTIGELSLAEIRDALEHDLLLRLEPAQSSRAINIFERYLEYLTAVDSLSPSHSLADQFEQLVQLRRHTLGDELADSFFGSEETYTRTVLAERAILEDATLNTTQQQEALKELHDDLPDELRTAREQAVAHHLALEQQQQYESLNISAEQRYQERAALYGEEAAERLALLDQEQQVWQQRLQDYQQQRQQIISQYQDQAQQQEALTVLRQSLFSAQEQRRVESLEAIGFPTDG